jgi:hypothetical protein
VLDAAGSATGILSFFVFLVSVLALLVQKYRILTVKALEAAGHATGILSLLALLVQKHEYWRRRR